MAQTATVTLHRQLTDGVVVVRPCDDADVAVLVAGRDAEFHRFLGPGHPAPDPVGCIVVDGTVVGWVDHDADRAWLEPGEVNVGYNVFAPFRGNGYASRAVTLLLHHLAVDTHWRTATLLIDPDNEPSLAVARRLGFVASGEVDGELYWKLPVARFAAPR